MAIRRLQVANFKSFRDLRIELGNFNVLIGANASGKSNFVQIFRFLRDITHYDLDNAISLQGGVEYLRNINVGSSSNLSIEITHDHEFRRRIARLSDKRHLGMRTSESTYKFELEFRKRGSGFNIASDQLTQKGQFHVLQSEKGKMEEKESLGEGHVTYSNINRRVRVNLTLPAAISIKDDYTLPPFLREEKLPSKALLVEVPFFIDPVATLLGDISIYDFDPTLSKKATPITGKAELEHDAGNLAIVLRNLLENRPMKRQFSNLVAELLPFVDDVDVEKFADKSLLFKVRELYARGRYLPATLISDGTINIIALIVALYFEEKPLTIIEEPERNIHPYLISKIVSMMKDSSRKKQVIVTTHNPEMIKHVDVKDLLLVSRDHDGFSAISRPDEKDEIKIFLEQEIGIEELYIQNLLSN